MFIFFSFALFFLQFNCCCSSRPSCFYGNSLGVDVLTTSITTTIPEKWKMKKLKENMETKKKKKKKTKTKKKKRQRNLPIMGCFSAGWFLVGLQNDKNPRWSMAQAIGSANVPGCHMVGDLTRRWPCVTWLTWEGGLGGNKGVEGGRQKVALGVVKAFQPPLSSCHCRPFSVSLFYSIFFCVYAEQISPSLIFKGSLGGAVLLIIRAYNRPWSIKGLLRLQAYLLLLLLMLLLLLLLLLCYAKKELRETMSEAANSLGTDHLAVS